MKCLNSIIVRYRNSLISPNCEVGSFVLSTKCFTISLLFTPPFSQKILTQLLYLYFSHFAYLFLRIIFYFRGNKFSPKKIYFVNTREVNTCYWSKIHKHSKYAWNTKCLRELIPNRSLKLIYFLLILDFRFCREEQGYYTH